MTCQVCVLLLKMISTQCCDEQEELAVHIKSSDKHCQEVHSRGTHKILFVHCKCSLLFARKTVYDTKNLCRGAFK